MTKVLLIGGAGFIGSYIAKNLIKKNDEVTVFDKFISYTDPFTSNYEELLNSRFEGIKDKITFIKGDIRYKWQVFRALKETQPDIVVHLAALPIATVANKFPEDAVSINLDGLINVLEGVKEVKSVKRFLFASSSFTYGHFEYTPADEKHPTKPIDMYGATKLSGEILTKAYAEQYGLKYTIIRPSAVYGFGDVNRRVVQLFVEKALQGKPLTLYEGGEGKADFTYVEDIANGFVLAMNSDKAINETFNITAGNAYSVKELAEIIKEHIPNIELEFKESDTKRPERGSLDIGKAEKLLGYKPMYDLKKGMTQYISDVKK